MKVKITKRVVDETTATDKPVFLFDSDLAGFVLKANPTGRKVYQLRYRMSGRSSPLKTFTIGTHGPLTPERARRQAQILIGDVRRGADPAAEKAKRAAEERGAATVEAIAADFMELHVKAKRKPRTIEEYEKLMRRLILPMFGTHRLQHVVPGDVERWHYGLKVTPFQANRALAVLSKLMSWATDRGFRSGENPCRAVEKYKEIARKRYLSLAEIAKVGEAIRVCEAEGSISSHVAAFFRIALLSGLRKDELRLVTWARIDLGRRVLVLGEDDSKSGQRDVPLTAPVLQILADLPRLEGNPFVFVGRRRGQPIVNLSKPWKKVLRTAGIDTARLHDLRHTTASIGVATGATLLLIGGVLGHRSPQTTMRYSHLTDDPVRATSEAIAKSVALALGDSNVMSMRRK
jgi:integrase